VRLPTFSRQSESEAAEADRPSTTGTATATTPVRPRSDAGLPPAPNRATVTPPPPPETITRRPEPRTETLPKVGETTTPVVTGPKPRASLLATFGLILGVASILLVLSGPLLGYGIGVAGLALILSLAGIHATGKRHVAGKTDALIGMVLSLGAIVLGVLALTGSLTWLGTDVQPVNNLREWLDSQFGNRF
jgi:hypothetical protein